MQTTRIAENFLNTLSELSKQNQSIQKIEIDLKNERETYHKKFFGQRAFILKLIEKNKKKVLSLNWNGYMFLSAGTATDSLNEEMQALLALDSYSIRKRLTKSEHLVHSMIGALVSNKPIDCYVGETKCITEDIYHVIIVTANEIGLDVSFNV